MDLGWLFDPPGAKGGWMALFLALLTLIYLAYVFWKYR